MLRLHEHLEDFRLLLGCRLLDRIHATHEKLEHGEHRALTVAAFAVLGDPLPEELERLVAEVVLSLHRFIILWETGQPRDFDGTGFEVLVPAYPLGVGDEHRHRVCTAAVPSGDLFLGDEFFVGPDVTVDVDDVAVLEAVGFWLSPFDLDAELVSNAESPNPGDEISLIDLTLSLDRGRLRRRRDIEIVVLSRGCPRRPRRSLRLRRPRPLPSLPRRGCRLLRLGLHRLGLHRRGPPA